MARIDLPDNLLSGLSAQKLVPENFSNKKTSKKKEIEKKTRFSNALQESESSEKVFSQESLGYSEEVVAKLLDSVHETGEVLKNSQNSEAIIQYKNAVRNFVHYVVDNAYNVDQRKSGGNILKRKVYIQVKVIDDKLEKLAAEILSKQKDKLNILAKLDEMNGLLVNLLQ